MEISMEAMHSNGCALRRISEVGMEIADRGKHGDVTIGCRHATKITCSVSSGICNNANLIACNVWRVDSHVVEMSMLRRKGMD
jgi:hypothetical protein